MIRLKEKGFTLIELIIIAAIVLILALIAIPRLTGIIEKSREGQTKENLHKLKMAAELYFGDHNGIWPTVLSSSPDYSFSKYLHSPEINLDDIPPVKVTGFFVPGSVNPSGNKITYTSEKGAPSGEGSGWLYDSTDGYIYVNSTVRDSQGIPYSFYGFQ